MSENDGKAGSRGGMRGEDAKWPSVGKREVGGKQGIGVGGRTGEEMWTSGKEGEYSKGREEGRGKATYLKTKVGDEGNDADDNGSRNYQLVPQIPRTGQERDIERPVKIK